MGKIKKFKNDDAERYGKDASEWVKRWDKGDRSIWSIEMGGLGPGYEQAIQITAVEIVRHLLQAKYDTNLWENDDVWKRDKDNIEKAVFGNPVVKKLGLSGAQWGAAFNLANFMYRDGPVKVMKDARVKDRHIQIRRNFPTVEDVA